LTHEIQLSQLVKKLTYHGFDLYLLQSFPCWTVSPRDVNVTNTRYRIRCA